MDKEPYLMAHFKIYWFMKEIQWCSSQLIQRALTELLSISDDLSNRSFSKSDIFRFELKSNWTIGEKILAFDQSQFDNAGEFYLKYN